MSPYSRSEEDKKIISKTLEAIRLAFAEFLTIPTCIIIGFLLLAAGSYALDRSKIVWIEPLRDAFKLHIFADTSATSGLLGTISSGIITVTSITISLLLLALQQSASSFSAVVFDQFLRRPLNQSYFGFFIGLALYALVTLGDGRLITSDGLFIQIETSAGSRQFSQVGAVPSAVPSFMRVSPNGTQVALGDGNRVFVFDPSAVNTYKTFVASNFDGEWVDEAKLAISSVGQVDQGTVVKVLDVGSGAITTIIQGIAGSPAGVTIDQTGNLYSGNGLGMNPSTTGTIKAFPKVEWMAPLSEGSVINFDSSGTLVANLLSAAFLGFDKQGNLYVGGGDFATGTDKGYAAIVSKSAIEYALAGDSPISSASPVTLLQRLDPDPDENFWFVNSNWVTGELYLKDYSSLNVNIFKN